MREDHKLFAVYLMKRLALADKTFQMSEQSYVENAVKHLGLSSETISEIDPGNFDSYQIPPDEKDRMTIFYYLLFLATTDRVMLSEEKVALTRMGFELGFREDQVRNMIEVVEKNQRDDLDPDSLINIIRSILN